jgi:hypothetical protein
MAIFLSFQMNIVHICTNFNRKLDLKRPWDPGLLPLMIKMRGMAGLTWSRRLRRLPLVVLLTIGMFFALLHCAECGSAFAAVGNTTVAVADIHHGASPEKSPASLVCHSGHCLSHAAAASAYFVAQAVDAIPDAPHYGDAQVLTSFLGLALFKPPRS